MHPSSDRSVRFAGSQQPDALAAMRAAVLARIAAGPGLPVVIDLDGLDVLDSAAIASLIRLGRDARERGASLSLRGGSASVVETLRITALGRVFPIVDRVSAPSEPPARPARRVVRAACLAALAVSIATLLGVPVRAAVEPTAQEIVANVVAQNPEMKTYEAQLSVDLRLKTFPWLSQHLDATTYFKRPNDYEVVFHDVPSYAHGFEKLYSDIDDPSGWDRRFVMTIAGRRAVGKHDDVVVRLVQRVRGMIDHQDVAIDLEHWRIDEMEWHYYNGGEISMTQDFVTSGAFTVLSAQHATIRIPHVSASAEASYTGYRTNVAIDDAVFAKSAGQAAK